jgi:hypothetical protein
MKSASSLLQYALTSILALSLVGVPEMAYGQSPAASGQEAPKSTASQTAPQAETAGSEQIPASSQPGAQPSDPLPDSPGAIQAQSTPAPQTTFPQPAPLTERPLGTAAAEIGNASGTAASKPAGVAIAPAKQHQSRSLLIKIGAVVGVGVALGTVVALSSSSPSRPPGSQ